MISRLWPNQLRLKEQLTGPSFFENLSEYLSATDGSEAPKPVESVVAETNGSSVAAEEPVMQVDASAPQYTAPSA